MGVGELVILDVLLHFGTSFTSLFECCGHVSVFFLLLLILPSAFLGGFQKKADSYFAKLLK